MDDRDKREVAQDVSEARGNVTGYRLGERTLSASVIHAVTGLTYRQLNEWDSRGLLPHGRISESGWRRVNAWELLALRVAADIRNEFGTPLSRLKDLMHWLVGESRPHTADPELLRAELLLYDPTPEEEADSDAQYMERVLRSKFDGRGSHLLPLRPDSKLSKKQLTEFVGGILAGRMVSRGWEAAPASTYAHRFATLTVKRTIGSSRLASLRALELSAAKSGDAVTLHAARKLTSVLLPTAKAKMILMAGYAPYLVTDLVRCMVLAHPTLIDWMRQGVIPKRTMQISLRDHINAVLDAIGEKTWSVTISANDVEPVLGANLELEEQRILEAIRRRDFESLVVENRDGRLRTLTRRSRSPKLEDEVRDILAEHDYQSIRIVMRGGKVAYVSQEVSEKLTD